MTFEYRDEDGDELFADRAVLLPAVFFRTPPNGCVVPADRIEELVAGIRDAARQAAKTCRCPHPADEHSVYGCADDCACEWMPQRGAARQAAGQPAAAVEETHIVADASDDPEHVDDCPGCETSADHDEHCPTPETHNWGCGCPTDKLPGRRVEEAVTILHEAMDSGVKDPVIRQKLIGQLVSACRHVDELRAAGQPDTQQQTEPLTDTERQFLTFALDLAADRMANRGDEFDEDDEAALARLRRMAEEAAQ